MANIRPPPSRWLYLRSLVEGLAVLWPIVSGILLLKAGLGAIVGAVEDWGLWKGVYFAMITGLTIGYGDLAPSRPATQVLAIVIGLLGVVLMGLVAALAVKAFEATPGAPNE
jgi:hypothetical protein